MYPEAEVYGCFFHYVQAITKRFKKFGLNKNGSKFDRTMQKIAALALLPNNFVVAGFNSIAKNFKKSKTFARFAKYWRKQCAGANISVYGLKNRTNNFAESLNKTINLLIGNRHPNVWRLVYNLLLVEMDRSDELERVVDGEMIKERRNKEMKRLNKKILASTELFEEDHDVDKFLARVTFGENLQMFFKERIHIDGIDEGEELLDEEDEVIPNNFRKVTNFRSAFPRKCIDKELKEQLRVITN